MNKEVIKKLKEEIQTRLDILEIQEGYWTRKSLKEGGNTLVILGNIQKEQKEGKEFLAYLKEL